jgi:putative DNA primase/helicase
MIHVSMVMRCHDTETHPITFDEIWDAIRTGKHGLKEKITLIRNRYEAEKDITGDPLKAKKAIADLKMELPGFLPVGTFSKRSNDALVEYSGILCADLDTLGDRLPLIRESLKSYPFIHAIALSPSGDGLKVFINVVKDPLRHEDSFRAIQQFFRNEAGLEIDEKCKDKARITFFPYDENLFQRTEGNEVMPPADPLPRGKTNTVLPINPGVLENLPLRERILAQNLNCNPEYWAEKQSYKCPCPGQHLHTNKTLPSHCMVYLDSSPTIVCQHKACDLIVRTFEQKLRSDIGKAEWEEARSRRPLHGKNGPTEESPEIPWIDIVTRGAVTATELSGLHIVPRKRILGDWFCEGDLGFFFGPRGAGKTWFTLGFVQAITTAGSFGDWKAPEVVKALYVDGEMPPDSMQERCEGLGAINDNLTILNHAILFDRTDRTINITNPSIQEALMTFCLDHGIKVLLLDNLSTLGVGMKENDADSWEMVNTWLLMLRKKGIAVVIIHHSGRSGQMRGTSRREDNVFWIISIDEIRKEEESGARFTTRFTKASRNTPNEIPDYEWHFKPDETTGLVKVTFKLSHSLTVFRSVVESGVTKPSEIAKVMHVEDYQVSRMAHKAIGEGWLERISRGEYTIISGK